MEEDVREKSSFAREHFESRIQENKKIEKDGENPERPSGKFKDRSLDRWRNSHLGRVSCLCMEPEFSPAGAADIKKDETLGLPDEQEKGVFEIMPTGLPDWKKMAEVIYTDRSSPYSGHR